MINFPFQVLWYENKVVFGKHTLLPGLVYPFIKLFLKPIKIEHTTLQLRLKTLLFEILLE